MYPDSKLNLNYETDDAVYFFTTTYEPLSNWSAHQVRIWGHLFPTAEHAFHYRKFIDTAHKLAEKILKAPSPWAAMQIERANKSLRRPDWQDVKVEVMKEIIIAKMDQNKDAQECLLKTGSKKIIENSPWDNFWGIGPDGKGENRLGKILMDVRESLLNNNG